MTRPRKALISLADTPYYHITSRCVRRAFLCGEDQYSGKCYEHRRQWIVDRVRLLSSVFAIDVCASQMPGRHTVRLRGLPGAGRLDRAHHAQRQAGLHRQSTAPDSRSTAHFSGAMACQQHAIRSHSSKAIQSREPAVKNGIVFTHKTGSPRSAHASGWLPVVQIPSSAEI